jgi:hypothetical protein
VAKRRPFRRLNLDDRPLVKAVTHFLASTRFSLLFCDALDRVEATVPFGSEFVEPTSGVANSLGAYREPSLSTVTFTRHETGLGENGEVLDDRLACDG